MTKDQHRFRVSLQKIRQEKAGQAEKLKALELKIQASCQQALARKSALPSINFPSELPISQSIDTIRDLISQHQVVIVAGETGSGKTTQLPKLCLDMGLGIKGMIGHTQPRRLAARTVCNRIGEELAVNGTSAVAYQVRFQDYTDENTYVKLMTDGILLSEIREDPFLNKYDTLIIDEAHERSLNIDFLLGYLKRLLRRRPDLKLIVTSATIDVEKFSLHFDNAPVIEVSGRTYPVNYVYQSAAENAEEDLDERIVSAIHEIRKIGKKSPIPHRDILVFLSGEKEIRDTANTIRKDKSLDLEVLPLYARLTNKEQNRVFQAHTKQRVVLATNVAETSLTVPGIGYVIDSGMARISRYSVRSKIQRLPIEAVSQASANQRAGRCGRLCPGTCVRLYSEEDFNSRAEYTDTEITRTNLASVILQMLVLKLGDIESFPFVDPPETTAIKDGFKILEELGAVDSQGKITRAGRQMASFPVDPRLARILLAGAQYNCLNEILIIVSALSIQDPRERPQDKRQAADEAHSRYSDPESDFMAWVNLWQFFEEKRQVLGRNRLGKFCHKHFLSYLRMTEWREVHRQLKLLSREMKFSVNSEPASYEKIHLSLLSGLVSNVANRLDDHTYLGARNRKFRVFPGSDLHGKKYPWILAAELVETSQLFARMNAKVEPGWIEDQAKSLLKYHYAEPHWEKRRGKVIALEKVTLYGLVLAENRKVVYSPIDPVVSREIFIREGLVSAQINTRLEFYHHYVDLKKEIESLEDKTRRKDILLSDDDLAALFEPLIPAEVVDQASLERWVKRLSKDAVGKLFLNKQDLQKSAGDAINLQAFPDKIQAGHLSLELDYQFDPGKESDGVSVDVPVTVLMQLKEMDLDWLVPGMLREKCIAMVKALPKSVRKNFVPVPDYIDRVLARIKLGEGDLKAVLAIQLQGLTGVSIPVEHWKDFVLPDHLRMNINVLDDNARLLGSGRDLLTLKAQFAEQSRQAMEEFSEATIERSGITDWDFGELDAVHEIKQGGLTVLSWPALIDDGESVSLKLADSPVTARKQTRAGVARLYMLKNRQQLKYLQKHLLQDPLSFPLMKNFGGQKNLVSWLIQASYQAAFKLDTTLPANAVEFESTYEAGRASLIETSAKLEALLITILTEFGRLKKHLEKYKNLEDLALQQDIGQQLNALVNENFLVETPVELLGEFPRYFSAITQRLEKYPGQKTRDAQYSAMLQQWWQRYEERKSLFHRQHKSSVALEEFRWMLEELRVSLFAQVLGTRYPVSEKRLDKAWKAIE